jgi:acylphosphatase
MIVSMTNQNDSNEIQELHAYVRGWVQGVGFRYFVVENALTLGLRGYARNGRDGNVEVLAQGPRSALERLLALLRQGPPAADVSEVRTEWVKPKEHLSGFHVRW